LSESIEITPNQKDLQIIPQLAAAGTAERHFDLRSRRPGIVTPETQVQESVPAAARVHLDPAPFALDQPPLPAL
jgi:hypothetical protein